MIDEKTIAEGSHLLDYACWEPGETRKVNYAAEVWLRENARNLLALASFGLKAKGFLEEHGIALHDGCLWAVSETFGTSRQASGEAAAKAAKALSDLLESARALESGGGK